MKIFVFFLVVFASNQFARCGLVDPPRTNGCEVTEAALAELAELRRIVGQLATLVERLVGGPVEPATFDPEPLPCYFEDELIPHQGERRVDECTLCSCDNGTLSCPLDCPDVTTNVNELPCVYEGKPLNHLEELRPGDCMLCVCNNGTVSCDDEPGCTEDEADNQKDREFEPPNDVVTDVELVYTWREASVLWTPPVEDVIGYTVKLLPVEGVMGEVTERLSPLETSWMTSEVVPGVGYTITILPIMSDGPGTLYTTDPFTPACPEICPLIYAPLCATDGETYSSNCSLEVAQCETQDETLVVDYMGPCDPCREVVCDVPVCEDGFVVAEEPEIGECCVGCVDPCEGIFCDVPICSDGFVVAKEPAPGECCVGCVDPCEGIPCDVPVCEEGLVVAQVPAPGECCVGCVDPCELIACDEPICVDDYVLSPPAEGECCAGCTRRVFEDCSDAAAANMTTNKAYLIQPVGVAEPFEAQCDFELAGGRWTVILRRIESPENFFREYDEYVAGFGDANDAYFIGLENLYHLNKQGNTRMAIRGIDHLGEEATGTYNVFRMANATDNYTLNTIVGFKGSIGNAFGYNKGAAFSAPGRDMDNGPRDCATVLGGGWWHKGKICTRANPLGEYLTPDEFALEKGIFWAPFKGKGKSLQYLELKVRPV